METRKNSRSTHDTPQQFGVMWLAGVMLVLLLCVGLTVPGSTRLAQAQGISPTNTIPTPYQCMHIVYARVTETSVVIGVRNNTGATTRLQTATLDWPSELGSGGDYVDYFVFGGQFYSGNSTLSPTSATAPDTTTYQITNGQTREFVAAFGPLPLPTPLSGDFTVTLLFRNGCSVNVTVNRPKLPTSTLQPTNTQATPGQCMYIQYAYVTELTVVVGVNNNTAATTRLQTATLDWPSSLGGTGGIYVDYFQFAGSQFYGGNDTAPPTAATASNSATYQITPGQTRNFAAAFGLAPLTRPLYGTFTVTLLFRNGCTVSVSVVREPPPSSCPAITNAYISGANLIFVVYNGLGADTTFTGASLGWTDIPTPPSPNRYVNYFSWGTDQFYTGNDSDPPTAANDSTPDAFTAGQTTSFTANFGNPGVLSGSFSVSLNFSVPCSATRMIWWGMTPTFTPSSTPTDTLTPSKTPTPVPLQGASSVRFASLLYNAPDYDRPAQSIYGNVQGGDAPYTVTVYIKAPSQDDEDATSFSLNMENAGSFELSPAITGEKYLGCSEVGVWYAWFDVTDSSGGTPARSNRIPWTVDVPQVHGIP